MEHKQTPLQSGMPSVNDAPENIGTSKRITRTRKSARDSSFSTAEGLTSQTSERRNTRSARGTLPIDDDGAHYYPCPVPSCDYSSESRSARNYHLRVDHAGYDYQNAGQGSSVQSTSRHVTRKPMRAEKKEGASRKIPTTSSQTVKIESELDDLHPFEASASRVDDYHHVDSSDAYSEIEDFEAEGGRYDLSHYSGDDVYSEEKFDGDFVPTPHVNRRRGRPKNPPGTEPAPNSKIRVSDPNGKYKCYMPDCDWRGAYRSLRCDHMKWCHKDWVMPPRYILQRITKDGIYIDPKTFVPPFSCPVDGCTWRGSYRASRSQHVRSVHPDYVPPKKKAPIGGFVADGKYLCHVTGCPWRGISRSTRASHMRKVHGGFNNPTYSARQVACCDCPLTFVSHKNFVDHVITAHRVGGLVHRDFSDIGEYEEWFNSVQEVFSIAYVKRMGIKQGNDYQVLYLYCARSGGNRPKQLSGRDYFPEFTKRRLTRRPTKCGRNCAAFLRIIHWVDGRLTVIGCVEHTGHRMGTALLRLSANERIVLDEYLYVVDDKVPLDSMLDRIREVEGFTMDGFDVTERNVEDMTRFVMNENEFVSLKVLFETSAFFEPDSTFGVKLPDNGKPPAQGISFGIMTSQMRELWRTCSARAACIEEVNLLISNFELHLFFVIVFDVDDMPRCACVFISQDGDKVALLEKLRSVFFGSTTPVDTIVTDCSPDWPSLLDAYFGSEAYTTDFQIAEWHLLSDWAARLDEMVSNRVDRFAIICALRRWTRATDPTLFEGIVIDMFEAFREMDLNALAQLVDAQLTDPDFAKRWTPLNRNPLTDHSNPVLEISCRMFRDRFLNCELCARLDEYAGLLNERIAEFNSLTFSEVYTTAPMEPPRQVPQMYEDIDPSQLLADGTVMSSPQHAIEVESGSPAPEHKRMKVEVEEEIGEYVVVAEEEVLDEVVEGPEAEQLVAEAVLNGALGNMDRINGGLELSQSNSSSSNIRSEESPESRKARLKQMMQILREKVDSMADDETMELMESGLTHVVEQLKEPPQNAQNTPRRSARTPKPIHQASL